MTIKERFGPPREKMANLFGGIPPSKTVEDLTRTAFSVGVTFDKIIPIAMRAGTAAFQEGRTKVGNFGQAGKAIKELKGVIESSRRETAFEQAIRKPSRR